MLSGQCELPSLPAVNLGVVGIVSALHVASGNDPEKYSKEYKSLDYFAPPPCDDQSPPNSSVTVLSTEENGEHSSNSLAQSDKSDDSEKFVSNNEEFCVSCCI